MGKNGTKLQLTQAEVLWILIQLLLVLLSSCVAG